MAERRTNAWIASPILWITAGAALLRLVDLTARSLWFDEAVSMLIARSDLAGAVRAADAEKLPPLYNLVLHLFLVVFRGEAAARVLSVLAGAATVPVVYRIGVRLSGKTAGLVAAGLLALSPFHLWYSQEIRMYALQTLLASISCLAMLRLLDGDAERRDRAGVALYAVATALALYAQYTSLFLVVFQDAFFLAAWKRHRAAWKRWLAAQVAAGALFLPWLPRFFAHFLARTGDFWLPDLSAAYLLSHFANFAGGLQSRTALNPALAWVGLLGCVACAALVLARKEDRAAGAFLAAWFFVPTVALAATSLGRNIFLSRSLLFTVPPYCLLVALATRPFLSRSWKLAPGLALLGVFFAGSGYGVFHYFADPNWWIRPPHREIAERLARICQDGDLIVHVSRFTYRPYQFYQRGRCAAGLIRETEDTPGLFRVIGDSGLPQDTSAVKRIWLVAYDDFQQPREARKIAGWMNRFHVRKEVLLADRLNFVALYERKDPRVAPPIEP